MIELEICIDVPDLAKGVRFSLKGPACSSVPMKNGRAPISSGNTVACRTNNV